MPHKAFVLHFRLIESYLLYYLSSKLNVYDNPVESCLLHYHRAAVDRFKVSVHIPRSCCPGRSGFDITAGPSLKVL